MANRKTTDLAIVSIGIDEIMAYVPILPSKAVPIAMFRSFDRHLTADTCTSGRYTALNQSPAFDLIFSTDADGTRRSQIPFDGARPSVSIALLDGATDLARKLFRPALAGALRRAARSQGRELSDVKARNFEATEIEELHNAFVDEIRRQLA